MKIYNFYSRTKDRIAISRGFNANAAMDMSSLSKITRRAIEIVCLDIILCEHRKKYGSEFNPLDGKKALHHKLLIKYQWPLEKIRALSLEDIFLVLHDELSFAKLDNEHAKFLEDTANNYDKDIFNEYQEEDWDPNYYQAFPEMLR